MSTDDNAGNIWFGPPDGYVEPKWPGLYNPIHGSSKYLYRPEQIWRFVVYDTLLLFGSVFLLAGCVCALNFHRRHFRLAVLVAPAFFTLVGLALAFVSATVVGYCLAAVYNASFLRMTTWVPAIWALVQILIVILSATTIQNKAFMG
ncbi:hypothetical protein JCM10908_004160 [Rhodotorula pacifica]|uniref:May24p n=1 Tax=Rhodotorula pacifica TaxID=1495444 RepID=UPI00317E37D3